MQPLRWIRRDPRGKTIIRRSHEGWTLEVLDATGRNKIGPRFISAPIALMCIVFYGFKPEG